MNMNQFRPMLFTSLKSYNKNQFVKDLISGIIVAIIALPLSIALALASGVGPEEGIYTAIVAGFVISFLGGSTVQIAGPTAAFATIVAGIVAKSGMSGLATATILAGIILVIMGVCKLGSLIKFIPFTITTGFTSGIALTILLGQIKDKAFAAIPTAGPSWRPETKSEYIPHALIEGEIHTNHGQSTVGVDKDGSDIILSAFCQSCITGEKAKDVVEEAYCSTLLCLLGNQAMEEKRLIDFPEEYKIPYMKF